MKDTVRQHFERACKVMAENAEAMPTHGRGIFRFVDDAFEFTKVSDKDFYTEEYLNGHNR